MIRINNTDALAVKHIAQSGADRLTIHMEDDIEKAVRIFRRVEVIEAESLGGQEIYTALTEEGARIISLHCSVQSGMMSVTLQGIARTDE